ncbi:hypothetical protein EZS27_022958 [termite gut metagenome]|uniref:KilA-N DNA-binding domain-containing protein n=1 Tax=termite gut metagenome TaxID=433724 RepID=A0A5J4R320_9ZZZZ
MNELISPIEQKIYEVRGQKVMLDFDLAGFYQVKTKRLKEQVRRNIERFPYDFMFELTKEELNELVANCDRFPDTLKHSSINPTVFTEQGVAMFSSVLHSETAIKVNISIMRAFVTVKNYLANNISTSKEIEELKKEIKLLNSNMSEIREDIESLNKSQENTDGQMEDVFQAFAKLSAQIQSKTAQLERIRIKGFKQSST